MNTKGKISVNESRSKTTTSTMRWAGRSAIAAGICFVVIGMFHPLNVPESVTTAAWLYAHVAAFALGFFGLFGMAGLYARQARQSGWLGLAGFLLITIWMTLVSGFSFVEAFILPRLATESPEFVAGFLGMFTGVASEIDLGVLQTLWNSSGPMIILGPLLFGIATFRARILPRWAGALLAVGGVLIPAAALFPPEMEPKVLAPIGLALAWLGYALVSERQEKGSEVVVDKKTAKPEASQAA